MSLTVMKETKTDRLPMPPPPEKKYAALVRTIVPGIRGEVDRFVDRFVPLNSREDMLEYAKANPKTKIIEYTSLKITLSVGVDVT